MIKSKAFIFSLKAYFLIVLFFSLLASCAWSQTRNPDSLKFAEIKVFQLFHDFGDVKEGDVVNYIFKFQNIGNDTLKIKDVRTTCGCTVPEWDSSKVYLPGEQGDVKVILNTSGKMSLYNKPFYIYSNAKSSLIRITLRANILKR